MSDVLGREPDARERRIAAIAQRVNEASDEHRDGMTLDYAVSMALCEDVNWLLRELSAVDSLRADAQRLDWMETKREPVEQREWENPRRSKPWGSLWAIESQAPSLREAIDTGRNAANG